MMIRSATAMRNDYDGMVKLAKEKQEPIFLTRNGEGEMVFLPLELWEKREAEALKHYLQEEREENRLAGAKTASQQQMRAMTGELLDEN